MTKRIRAKIADTSKMGRKKIYGEKTVTYSIAVPESKRTIIDEFVKNLLKTYRV